MFLIFPIGHGTANLSGRDHGIRESTLWREQRVTRNDFWSMEGDFIHHHHVEPRFKFHVPKEETFPDPLKHIDVTRTTHTNLEVLQEKHVDDCWNLDSNRSLSGSWTGFTKFKRIYVVWPAYRNQATARPAQKGDSCSFSHGSTSRPKIISNDIRGFLWQDDL